MLQAQQSNEGYVGIQWCMLDLAAESICCRSGKMSWAWLAKCGIIKSRCGGRGGSDRAG
jgi:hypothetical protein